MIGIFLSNSFPLGNKGGHVISTKDFLGEDPPNL